MPYKYWCASLRPDDEDGDLYAADVDDIWLDGETLVGGSVDTGDSGVTVSSVTHFGSRIFMRFSGGDVGLHTIKVTARTATREREFCVTLSVNNC